MIDQSKINKRKWNLKSIYNGCRIIVVSTLKILTESPFVNYDKHM